MPRVSAQPVARTPSLIRAALHFALPRSGVRFAARSRARRSAVRFFAAASDAFLARAERPSGVSSSADFFPPCRPNLRAISVIAARTSAGIFIPSSIHLTRYGDENSSAKRTARILLTPKGVRCIVESVLMFDYATESNTGTETGPR